MARSVQLQTGCLLVNVATVKSAHNIFFYYECHLCSFGISVHLRVEEKISLTCGRDGGLQNMEVLGMITLKVTDEKSGHISILIDNNDKKGAQLQVGDEKRCI